MGSIEWEAPGIVLGARPHGEADAIASVFTEEHGPYRGLVRGGFSRARAAIWQAGNLVQLRWTARLPEQLGNLTGELVHPTAAHAMDDPVLLAAMSSACAVADVALPERTPHPRVFSGLLQWLAQLGGAEPIPALVRWELILLSELGYGLDLSRCAVTGAQSGLAWVSPRTGRAVTDEAAEPWRGKLLRLPGFLVGGNYADAADWRDGLALTGHFLARDVMGAQHRPVPAAREMLYDRVARLADSCP